MCFSVDFFYFFCYYKYNIFLFGDTMILESIIEELTEHKGLFELAVILSLVYYIALTVAQWKIFEKAGEKGWKSLIPFYSVFLGHHIVGMRHFWFILDIALWVFEIFMEVFKVRPLWLEDVLLAIAIIITLIMEIIHIMKMCYCFTKSERFGIGLFVLPPVFSLILAFDKSEYNLPRSHPEHYSAKYK